MTRVARVLAVPAAGGYYTEDLAALQSHPLPLAERYTAAPVTPGFRRVREVAEAVSVGLVLDGAPATSDGVAWGDCVAVAGYRPTIHLDVHGALGQIFGNELGRVLGPLYALESAARPLRLRVECPVMMENREARIEAMKTLCEYVGAERDGPHPGLDSGA